MNHLNYFEPYKSKSINHEDQLTRAFLVVLRYSPSSLLLFYDLVYNKSKELAIQKNVENPLPYLSQLQLQSIKFETQQSDISNFLGQIVLSVLITDEIFQPKGKIKISERGARYDGVIGISDNITLLIENKPKSYNVWEEQLSPNLTKLSKAIKLVEVPAIIEWKSIISRLNELRLLDNIQGTEKLIIEDFLEYIDDNFSFLNPFEKLALCKKDKLLVNKRIKNLLEDIVAEKKSIGYQPRWEHHYILTGFDEIWMIIAEFFNDDSTGKSEIRISLYYGDVLSQARKYFKLNIPFSKINPLIKKGWKYKPNFHISSINSPLIWFDTKKEYEQDYYNYWLKNQSEIKQFSKTEFLKYLKKMEKLNLVVIDKDKQDKLESKLINTNRSTVNICPGFGIYYPIEFEKAEKLDMTNDLKILFIQKIVEGLSILNRKVKFLKSITNI